MRVLLLSAVSLVLGASCLSVVEERWCDAARPCSAGFVCSNYHCVAAGSVVVDAGATGGGASTGGGGGATGGGATGGGGGATGGGTGGGAGGGGAPRCGNVVCDGCCLFGQTCVPRQVTSVANCGANGEACKACAQGQLCQAGACVSPFEVDAGLPGRDGGVSAVGGPCELDVDCGANAFCLSDSQGFPGGYCVRYCEGEPCPSGSECIEAQTQAGDIINVCLASCPGGTGCRPGYLCDQGLCLP